MTDDIVKRLREYEWAHTVIEEAADRIEEMEDIINLRRQCDKRAIKMWQQENPEEENETWPDHADLCLWLMAQVERAQDTFARIQYTNLRRDMNMKNRTIEIDRLCKGTK